MTLREPPLDDEIETLLADPIHAGHPLHVALGRLWRHHQDQLARLERITRLSDAYQSIAQERALSLSQRFERELRRLEKAVRISDRAQQHLRDMNLVLHEASTLDPLTGLANRRLLADRLREEAVRADRHQRPLVVAMLDLDLFKQINDSWGHDVGDAALVETGRAMVGAMRKYDLCGRWGGEEFVLVLPETDLPTAIPVVDRVLATIRTLQLSAGTESVQITASVGVTQFRPGESVEDLLKRADDALLTAKRGGRDRMATL